MIVTMDEDPDGPSLSPDQVPSKGSSVLIDIKDIFPDLQERVLLTAAHVIINKDTGKPYKEIYFGGHASERIKAFPFPCVEYESLGANHDIALLILSSPSEYTKPVSVNWDIIKEELLGEKIVKCGYGHVERFMHPIRLIDTNKRASISGIFSPYSTPHGIAHITNTKTSTDPVTGIISTEINKMELNLSSVFYDSPFKEGNPRISLTNPLAGYSSDGDSGGGCFFGDHLIGLISLNKHLTNSGVHTETTDKYTPDFCNAYPYLKETLALETTHPRIFETEEANDLIDYSDVLSLSSRSVFIPYYKNWIFAVLDSIMDHVSKTQNTSTKKDAL